MYRNEHDIENIRDDLNHFLINWDFKYDLKLKEIKLFDPAWTCTWSDNQKQHFINIFYHLRGHFHEFLWFMANHADDKDTKEIVLKNISEEFNGSAASHEKMYYIFAEQFNVNLNYEVIDKKYYLDFAKGFNDGHIRWLIDKPPLERFAAFSAYERLDNLDYNRLLILAKSIGARTKGLAFFKVHAAVEHFETTEAKLVSMWGEKSQDIKKGFIFIASHQLNMWNNLSNYIDNLD